MHTVETSKSPQNDNNHQNSIFRIQKKKTHINISRPHLGNSQKLLNLNGVQQN